jgi:TRAP-type mannitol/chloroaromatic compound transport system substrate-binding protein
MTERRRFIAAAGGVMAAAATTAIIDAPSVIAQPKVQWRLSTAYPPVLDQLQGAAQRFAKVVEETSGGRFRIEVFPGGQIMPPFECFDATSKGTIEAFMGVTSYWAAQQGKDPGRPQRRRATEGSVAHAHDLDTCPRSSAGRGAAVGAGG